MFINDQYEGMHLLFICGQHVVGCYQITLIASQLHLLTPYWLPQVASRWCLQCTANVLVYLLPRRIHFSQRQHFFDNKDNTRKSNEIATFCFFTVLFLEYVGTGSVVFHRSFSGGCVLTGSVRYRLCFTCPHLPSEFPGAVERHDNNLLPCSTELFVKKDRRRCRHLVPSLICDRYSYHDATAPPYAGGLCRSCLFLLETEVHLIFQKKRALYSKHSGHYLTDYLSYLTNQ